MKKVKVILKNILNEEITLKGFIKEEDLKDTLSNIKVYEEVNDKDFFILKKEELIF